MTVFRRTHTGWVVLPLVAVVLTLLGLSPNATQAQTSGDNQDLVITLDSVSPAVATGDEPIDVVATVRNVGSSTVDVTDVDIQLANVGLDTATRIQGWTSGAEDVSTPITVGSESAGTLAPGMSADVEIEVDADAINPGFSFGTLPLAIVAADETGNTAGELRTVLPWYAAQPASAPVQVSWVVPLTVPAEPELLSEDLDTRTQAWLDTLDPDATTRSAIAALGDDQASFLIDPALMMPLAPVGDLNSPAQQVPMPLPTDVVTLEPPEQSADQGDAAAQTLSPAPTLPTPPRTDEEPAGSDSLSALNITELQRAELAFYQELADLGSDHLWFLPTADPDVAALLDVGADAELIEHLLTQQRTTGNGVGAEIVDAGRHDIAYPAWSQVDSEDLAELGTIWPATESPAVLVPSDAVANSAEAGASTVSVGDSTMDLLAFDTTIAGLLSQDLSPTSDGAAIQQTLALTMARYQRAPGADHSLVITPPRGSSVPGETLSDLSTAFAEAGWLSTVAADELLADAPASQLTGEALSAAAPGDDAGYPLPAPSPLSTEWIEQIEELRLETEDLSDVLPATSSAGRWGPVLDSLYSTRWRQDTQQWSAPFGEVEAQVAEVLAGVQVTPTTVNFLADEGQIQLTIANELPVDVSNLDLTLSPGNGRLRILDEPAQPLTIGADSRTSVHFRAESVAAGQVPITATLRTPSGTVLGDSEVVSVRVQPTGDWIYWVLGILGGGILILGLARLGRRPKRFDANSQGDSTAAQALDSAGATSQQPKDSA